MIETLAEPVPGDDVDRSVHLAHEGSDLVRDRGSALGGLVVGYGLAGLIGALFLFTRLVIHALGLSRVTLIAAWVILGLAIAAWGTWLIVRLLRANAADPPPGGTIKSDERFRVRCIGRPDRLDQLRRFGPVVDTPFEPQEFFGFFVLPPRPVMIVVWVLTSLTIGVGAYMLPLGIPPGASVLVIYGAFAAGGLAVILVWPTLIRVVPGRVDCIRWLVFTPHRPERRAFTLRSSRLFVDLRRWSALIEGPSRQTSISLWLWPVRGRVELAHALLMGAVSTARPAPLPGDPLSPAEDRGMSAGPTGAS